MEPIRPEGEASVNHVRRAEEHARQAKAVEVEAQGA